MSQFVIDLLQTVTFDIDFSDIDWMITDAEMIEELTYGRDEPVPIDAALN